MKTTMTNAHRWTAAVAAATALLVADLRAVAADPADEWTGRATLYLWAAGISGETSGGGELEMGFDQLIEHLNFALMGAFEARHQRWAFGADLLYLNVSLDDGGTVPLSVASGDGIDLDVSADAKTKGWAVTPRAAYNLLDTNRFRLDALLGVRYLNLDADLDLGLQAGRFGTRRRIAASVVTWDVITGAKGRVKLGDGWSLPYYADIGAGDSELTWQLGGGIAYSMSQVDLALWYRHMAWELYDGDALSRVSFNGPMLSASWRF